VLGEVPAPPCAAVAKVGSSLLGGWSRPSPRSALSCRRDAAAREDALVTSRLAGRRPVLVIVVAVLLAAAITAAAVLGDLHGGEDGQVGLDTAAATIGALLAYLLFGRFRESRQLRDLLLCGFLLLAGASNAVFSAIPRSFDANALQGASGFAGVVAGATFVAAAWSPGWSWPWSVRAAAVVLLASTAAALVGCAAIAPLLPREGMGSVDTFGATPDLALTVTQLCAALLFAVAAVGAARAAGHDPLLLWLTGAPVFATASRVDFSVSKAVADSWSTAGTILRVVFYAVLVLAAGTEIGSYWRRVAQVAVLEERRRMARDLHDGLAQELAFAATQARALADRSEHPTRARLGAAAAERALDESRRAIAALTRPLDEPLAITLAQCAEEVCDRFETGLVMDVPPGISAGPETREALLRILREAVANAARHSAASEVRVCLRQDERLFLRVEDDGQGFDTDDLAHLSGRFGLVSMRERAEALGGSFTIVSRLQGGTAVEVTLP
jgi:signal transduction histidine kinase